MSKPTIKTAFLPIKPTVAALPKTTAVFKASPNGDLESRLPKNDSVAVTTEFFLEVVDKPEKESAAWGYVGDPHKSAQFGRRIVAALNVAHWPAAAAVERRDLRAIKWLVCVALLERLSVQHHPILTAISLRLSKLALGRANVNDWERVLWAAYRLKDATTFASGLDSAPLSVGTLHRFGEITVRVSARKIADWNARNEPKFNGNRPHPQSR
jgi:hypothetical protein